MKTENVTRYVIDASVAAKWVLPEVHSEDAARVLVPANELFAPELLCLELSQVLLKHIARGTLEADEGWVAMTEVFSRLAFHSLTPLVKDSYELASRYGRSVYDCAYLALAVSEGCRVVTADRRLYNALHMELPDRLLWVEDIPV